jgi:hypothetical protein
MQRRGAYSRGMVMELHNHTAIAETTNMKQLFMAVS